MNLQLSSETEKSRKILNARIKREMSNNKLCCKKRLKTHSSILKHWRKRQHSSQAIFLHKYFWKSPFVELLHREHERDASASEKKVKNKIAEKEIWETETNINVKWGKSLFSPRRKKNKWNQRNLYREKILNKREKKLTNTNLKPETYKSTAKTTTTTTTVTYKQIKMLYFREINVNANSCRLGPPSPL